MIIGSVNQRTFEVSTSPHGSDTEGCVEIVRVSIELNGLEKHRAEGAQGVIGDLAKIGEETTQTGDQDFDRDVMIHAESEADVIEYWTTERKNVFLNLISDPDLEVITLEGSELFTEYRSVIPNSDQLEHAMNQLASAAERLDLSASLNE
jgi:hypothetical protein